MTWPAGLTEGLPLLGTASVEPSRLIESRWHPVCSLLDTGGNPIEMRCLTAGFAGSTLILDMLAAILGERSGHRMERPRFQFTIRRLVQLVVLAAVGCIFIRVGFWPLAVAWSVALPGFIIDRAHAGSGILGSMVAGLLSFTIFGFGSNLYSHLAWGGAGSDLSAGAVVAASGIIGLLGGATFGVCAWTLLSLESLIGWLRTRSRPAPKSYRRDS